MPAVDVSASGNMHSHEAKPTVMNGRLRYIRQSRIRESAHRLPRDETGGKIKTGQTVRNEIGQEMQGSVEEGEEAEHPPEPDHTIPAGHSPERCHG